MPFKFSKSHLLIILIIALGAFLRFYRLEENLVFHGEIGHNYLQLKNYIENLEFPLIGPPTQYSWVFHGPLFFWLTMPLFIIGKFDPVVGGVFFAAVGVATILVNYLVIKAVIGEKIALISSFLISFSPGWLDIARESRFYSLVILFFYIFFYFAYKFNKGCKRCLFWAFFFLGVMINFHYSSLILIPWLSYVIYQRRKEYHLKYYLSSFLGFLIPSTPFLFASAKDGFLSTVMVISWIPYRITGFFGFYPKNTLDLEILTRNLNSLYEFIGGSIFPGNLGLLVILTFLLIASFIAIRFKDVAKNKTTPVFNIFFILVSGYLALFIHGAPPPHYYYPLYALPVICIALLIIDIKKKLGNTVIILLLITIFIVDINWVLKSGWFFQPNDINEKGYASYALQKELAKAVVKDTGGDDFKLARLGPMDVYEGYYAHNYQYLMWLCGNEPTEDSRLVYTIYEGIDFQPELFEVKIVYKSTNGDIIVVKNKID